MKNFDRREALQRFSLLSAGLWSGLATLGCNRPKDENRGDASEKYEMHDIPDWLKSAMPKEIPISEKDRQNAEKLRPWFEKHKRNAWKPLVREGEGSLTTSKFAGTPWLEKNESWPRCLNCKQPIQFLLQLNLGELPKGINYGKGLLQLFYCNNQNPNCSIDCEAWMPFAKSTIARIVQPEGRAKNIQVPRFLKPFPAKTIYDWQILDDYPYGEDYDELGLEISHDFNLHNPKPSSVKNKETKQTLIEAMNAEAIYERFPCFLGDKLAGWPRWAQGNETPNCPHCRRKMGLVFQLYWKGNLPDGGFDADGIGHVMQCPVHKEEVSFGWAR